MLSFSVALVLWGVRAEGERRLRRVVGEHARRATAAAARIQLIRLCRVRVRPENETLLSWGIISELMEKNELENI